ncbi:unnamed protein product [Pleuronectes platessa]|uniref:Uncharacterized protein n=1 Tax=Pleuronectes platessa TaxID=8262 RepID=A0A9N7YNA0_PLEPL|nr:unnamed protein product [Pleuronectes platessa]
MKKEKEKKRRNNCHHGCWLGTCSVTRLCRRHRTMLSARRHVATRLSAKSKGTSPERQETAGGPSRSGHTLRVRHFLEALMIFAKLPAE